MGQLTVAVAGLGFGRDFVPIYLSHPAVCEVVLVEPDRERRRRVAEEFGLADGYADVDQALQDPRVDAVHILAPVALHAELAIAALRAGKHVACAVPMATSLEDLDRLLVAEQDSRCRYMMMETSVYSREFRTVAEMYGRGEFGSLTLYRGFHIQNLDGFPRYWQGFPPMHYLTHALSPLLSLLDTRIDAVRCRGAGTLTEDRRTGGFDNPFPTEVGLFTVDGSDLLADITMSFFQTARSYVEGFALYGDRLGVEWPEHNIGPLTVHRMTGPAAGSRGNLVATDHVEPHQDSRPLPAQLRPFATPGTVRVPGVEKPLAVGAGHGGSHPFLVNEFLSAVVENRAPAIDGATAARWTAPGICAHDSALRGGVEVSVPRY